MKDIDYIDNRKRIMQANLNNQGGAFSVAYEVQQQLQKEYIFDYFSSDKFVENDIYKHLLSMGSRCVGGVECKSRFLKQYEVYKAFKEYLKSNRYKFVHIHADTAWKILIYYLAAKNAGVENIVVHSHSSGINGHFKKVNYLLHLIAKPIIKKAKYRCACSDIAAEWMFNTSDNVNIIRNGIDIERFSFKKDARKRIREEMMITNKIVIGNISDFSYPKNPEFIFEIINAFKDNDSYLFLMIGNKEKCILKDYVDHAKLTNVIFAGMVTNTQDYLSAMDVFVLPSRFEGLPMCALEAQVSGLYTIISDKVTKETQCSRYFDRIELNIALWKKKILEACLDYDRNRQEEFLDIEKANAANMADEFRKIYAG